MLNEGGKYPGGEKFLSVAFSAVPCSGGHAPAPLGVAPPSHHPPSHTALYHPLHLLVPNVVQVSASRSLHGRERISRHTIITTSHE